MRAVIQRVSKAEVNIKGTFYSTIGLGLLVFVGVEEGDEIEDIEWLSGKINRLRIFTDENGMMNLSVKDVKGELLVISQFTLHASTKKGNRPSFLKAARPDLAIPMYEKLIKKLEEESGTKVMTGVFGADMQVNLVNDGPVTITINTKNKE